MTGHSCDCPECGGNNYIWAFKMKEYQRYPLGRVCDYCERLFLINENGRAYPVRNRFLDEVDL